MGHAGRRYEAILIAGPTASGKSALALRLARRLGGTIVNADSMQVYRDLRVLTARPTAVEMAEVPHRLYGTVDGADSYSVSRWLADAAAATADARDNGRVPIVVGGTGLFFKALVDGLSAIPAVPDAVRAEVRGWAVTKEAGDLHALLAAHDPVMAARLRPSDPQRIARALEVVLATGRSLSAFQAEREPPTVRLEACVALALAVDRDTLRRRIDTRFDAMVAGGALDEATALAARALPSGLPVMRAIGVPPLLRHLEGTLGFDEAVIRAKTDSRQYLKRQDTFVRHQLPGFRPVEPDRAEAFVVDQYAWPSTPRSAPPPSP